MTPLTNPYCAALGIRVPTLEGVREHPEASTYALLIVTLLERGAPMTLHEVAERFARADVAAAEAALMALKRCRPARAPVYRDGDHYSLDPHDHDLDLWAFRLGLRPARGSSPPAVGEAAKASAPLPGGEVPLGVAELDEAWRGASLYALVAPAHRNLRTRGLSQAHASAGGRRLRLRPHGVPHPP